MGQSGSMRYNNVVDGHPTINRDVVSLRTSRRLRTLPVDAAGQLQVLRQDRDALGVSAARLVSSKTPTRYASAASWRAMTAEDWKRRSILKSWAISLTSRWKGICAQWTRKDLVGPSAHVRKAKDFGQAFAHVEALS